MSDYCIEYAMDLVRATRRGRANGIPKYIAEWLAWGAGPRAGQSLIMASKAKRRAGRAAPSVTHR